MHRRSFIKINCMITLFAFLISIFSANFAFVGTAAAQENILNKITEGIWKVKTVKGEFDAAGTGGYEKWADGKQRFVLRDSLGHLLSWGEAKIDKLSGGQLKVTVKDNEGTFEAVKVSAPVLETAAAVKSAVLDADAAVPVSSVPASALNVQPQADASVTGSSVSEAPKTTLGQKLSALKEKITTPIETGGKSSSAWEKGYNFGKDTPTNVVNKVKGIFTKGDSSVSDATASSSAVSQPASGSVSAAPASSTKAVSSPAADVSSLDASASVSKAVQVPSAVEATAPKAALGQKLSALKEKITTPIETGGKGSTAWEKGYSFGKDTPANVVDKVKGVFTKGGSTAAESSVSSTVSQPVSDSAPASSASSMPSSTKTASGQSASAPSLDAAVETAPKTTLGQKLSALKEKVTTPIETGGKGSAAWEKGYSFGKDTPTKAVDKVKSLFNKNSQSSSIDSQSASASSTSSNTASGPSSAAPSLDAAAADSSAPQASAVVETAPKTTLGQKLSALKEKVTTPIETGGKGSDAWEKGYKFGKETPEKAVSKVKGLFKKSSSDPVADETAASGEPTPSQKMADQSKAAVEFDEETGQFQKAVVSAAPSKLSTALSAGKDSLKASFSIKNLGISAGLTVGFKIFEQVKNGEKISIGKAVGHLATGEFAGSFVGSGLGSAAGTVVGSLLGSSVPVVGPILGALMPAIFGQVGGHIGASMGDDLASGQKPSFKKAIASIDKVAVLGQAVGSTIGAAIGSMLLPGFGSMIGGLAGSMIANIIINKIRNRASSNYHVSGVNAQGGQVIYGEQLAPPPAQPVLQNMGVSASGDGAAQSTYDRMINAYKLYSQMLSEGKGETPECQQALSEYKQLYTNYAGSVQGQNIK